MSVIVELTLPPHEFELGRILQIEESSRIVLETMVPLGERSVPFFRVKDGHNRFPDTVSDHPAVDNIHIVNTHNEETLYALDWEIAADSFFKQLVELDVNLLEASGTADQWGFELRFPSHDTLSVFQERCADGDIPIEIRSIYNPTRPDAGPWFGLTGPQRQILIKAVQSGYYSIPRQISTVALAEEFGISDQAVTERLRRGITSLVTNTLLLSQEER